MGIIIGDHIGTTVGIHSLPFPSKHLGDKPRQVRRHPPLSLELVSMWMMSKLKMLGAVHEPLPNALLSYGPQSKHPRRHGS